MRWVVIVLIWVTGAVVSLVAASETSVGPVVLRLSRHHGVHLGDLVVVASAIVLASMFTALVFSTW